MKNINIWYKKVIACLLMLVSIGANAQQGSRMKALKIGDKMPNISMPKILINGKLHTQQISDYKDKLLILDFWDTFCASCIESFPKLNAVQDTYGSKLQIITITYQKEEVVRKFKEKNKIAQKFNLPIMIEDQLFKAYFPHRFVSHTVWINKGVVIAISGSEYINSNVINKVLTGAQINLPLKDDFLGYDFKNSSLLDAGSINKKMIYSTISGYKEGVTSEGAVSSSQVDSVNGLVKDVYLNAPGIVRLYIRPLYVITKFKYSLKPDMIIVEAKNPETYDMNYMKSGMTADEWLRKYGVCYESVLPVSMDAKERAKTMLSDLDNKLGLYGRIEMRPHKVLVIKSFSDVKAVAGANKDIEGLEKQSLQQFLLNAEYAIMTQKEFSAYAFIFDESNVDINKMLDVRAYNDPGGLKHILNVNGLDLVEEIRPMMALVLTEVRKTDNPFNREK